ncbi:sensor histidine kinase [Paraglaciecola sp. 2405UD69-4]|uniref:sensor histidine kinase n=1 Tax=Paraglaciecola sp. 2405UD69-4 TaxID=3391836 RepID=UPI0039C96DB3
MFVDKTVFSIKRLILWVVLTITSLSLLFSSAVHLYSQITTYQKTIEENVVVTAEVIGHQAIPFVVEENDIVLQQLLAALALAPTIENVHVYKVNSEPEMTFLASFNKAGIAPVRPKYTQVNELFLPQMSLDVIEVVRPINLDGDLIGYVYIRSSVAALDMLISQSISITVGVVVFCLVVCFLLILKLQNSIALPIEDMVKLVQRISRTKDYSSRVDSHGIKELDILGNAFNGMLFNTQEHMEKQAQAEAELLKLNVSLEGKVQQRTLALKEANAELIQTLEQLHQFQRQIVQNEKMASLGDMVAGVAHEVNTPIGLGVTASTMMLDRLGEMRVAFEGKTLKASTLSRFINEGEENLNIIYRNLNRAAELISSFKQVAVDQSSESSRVFAFSSLMNEILISMGPTLKKTPHKVYIDCVEDLVVESKAGPINQIMINLIMNSIIHGFEGMDEGNINIKIELIENTKVKIEFVDNGKGIPEHIRKKIFDPFVTTKRGQGGSGLGMHLVYNLVTQALNGTISVSSEEGHGVYFSIVFPVKLVNSK